jgi:psiF repeat
MKTTLIASLLAASFAALAIAPVAAASPAQERRAACKADAGSRVGAERKEFMASCLNAKKAEMRAAKKSAPSQKQLTQRARMKACSEEFKIAGQPKSERRAFISACLKRA